ncbi:phage replisome organizer N-terminal domain-containing protein [Veillonella caviae]|uniref:phage replisome organizer N-terminal domain-containing protein n=1 Tax=Veillonella caviae TaxID=248316 RepID=UPI0023F0C999|nr:phage replisome organizer N-terminal domain-containing protein [Veillonella caviae]MCI6407776.1 phage replisome organizer N-terminal domain-containing protein [Veillonella caviae]MDY6224663.1 phage replisome organizer N-terminal domain-containing protein [Veillonella caviae]
MAKRYYWLKLQNDFFSRKEIKKLRKIAGGDTLTIIYLKMLCCSLQNEGKLMYEGLESDFVSEVALDIDEDIDNVQITIAYLLKTGLLVQVDDDEYSLLDAEKNIGSESAVAARVRKHREKEKALQCNTEVTEVKQISNVEIEKDIDIDIDIDTEKDISINVVSDLYDLWVQSFGVISSFVKGLLDDYAEEYGLTETAEAIRIAKKNGKSKIKYVEGVLKNRKLENATGGRESANKSAKRKAEEVDWAAESARVHGSKG